jgi:serine O-acetyltransferase
MFDNIKADLNRYVLDGSRGFGRYRQLIKGILSQGFQATFVYRAFRWLKLKHIPGQPFRFIFERFIEITTGISIPVEASIGPGLKIHHFGGIIIHPKAQIGELCTLYHDVTIGDRGGYGASASIGNHVMLGAGAKIIGEITIGDNCRIGANSVVTENVPANSIVYGNPCIILNKYK